MADTDIIELLNGMDLSPRRGPQRPSAVDKVYLDDSGAPTDRFLDALRIQEDCTRSVRRSVDNADILAHKHAQYPSDVDNESDSTGYSEPSADSDSDLNDWCMLNQRSRSNRTGNANHTRSASQLDVQATNKAKSTHKLTRRREVDVDTTKTKRRSGRSTRLQRSNDDMILSEYSVGGEPVNKKGVKASRTGRARARSVSSSGRPSSRRGGSPPRTRATCADPKLRHDPLVDGPSSPAAKDWTGDLSSIHEKVRTYKLRIAGQLQTIRSLEVKLGETELELKSRDNTLGETKLRLQALERREKNSFLRGMASDVGDAQPLIPPATRERDAIRKLKSQIVELQEKVKESNLKIRQGNERYRIAKTALDRSTAEVDSHKTTQAKVELTLTDTQNALMKSRRENKELSAQIESYKGQVQARCQAEQDLEKDLQRAENTLKDIRTENESNRVDLNKQAKEIGFLQESNRRMELELRLLREKDAVHKLEKRALSKVITHKSNPPPASRVERYEGDSSDEDDAYNKSSQCTDPINFRNGARSAANSGGMETVLAWERDYAQRRGEKLRRGDSLSPPRSPPRPRDRYGVGRSSSPGRPIGEEKPSASVPPSRPTHPLTSSEGGQGDNRVKAKNIGHSETAAGSLASAEQIKQRHDRLQQMYARVTKGKGTAHVTVA